MAPVLRGEEESGGVGDCTLRQGRVLGWRGKGSSERRDWGAAMVVSYRGFEGKENHFCAVLTPFREGEGTTEKRCKNEGSDSRLC